MVIIKKANISRERKEKEQDLKISLIAESSPEETEIEVLIRRKYSLSQEIALHRKSIMGVCDKSEWDDYCTYVQECIDEARAKK